MWVAGYGSKALATAGRHADGFILQLADPQILEWTMAAVREAAEEAGRNPDDIEICVVAPPYVGDALAYQRDQLRWFGEMVGNHVADLVNRYGDDSAEVPQALTDYIKQREGYDYDGHGRAGNVSVDFVPDEIIDRLCVLGPGRVPHREAAAARGHGCRPVRDLPDARRHGGDPQGLRRRHHPGLEVVPSIKYQVAKAETELVSYSPTRFR